MVVAGLGIANYNAVVGCDERDEPTKSDMDVEVDKLVPH